MGGGGGGQACVQDPTVAGVWDLDRSTAIYSSSSSSSTRHGIVSFSCVLRLGGTCEEGAASHASAPRMQKEFDNDGGRSCWDGEQNTCTEVLTLEHHPTQ